MCDHQPAKGSVLTSLFNQLSKTNILSFLEDKSSSTKNRGYPFHGICMHLLHIFTQEIWFSQWDFGGFTQIFKPRSLGNLYSPLQSHLWHCGSWDSQRTNQSHQVFRWQCPEPSALGICWSRTNRRFPRFSLLSSWLGGTPLSTEI